MIALILDNFELLEILNNAWMRCINNALITTKTFFSQGYIKLIVDRDLFKTHQRIM